MEKSTQNKYLVAARRAREDNNTADALKYYDMVRTDDPDCAEARFFYAYYNLLDSKQKDTYNCFTAFADIVCPSVRILANSEESETEKYELLKAMVKALKLIPLMVNRALNNLNKVSNNAYASFIMKANRQSINMLYSFGDEVEEHFSSNSAIMKDVAVESWKEGVSRQQMWYGVGVDKSFPDKYTAKIQKFDASYVMPKKAGCIQIAK